MTANIQNKLSIEINAPAEKVWQALTDSKIISQYFFGTHAESDWKPGSSLTFSGEYEGKTYQDKGTILETEVNKVLRYNYWSSMSGIEDKPENYAIITFRISEENGMTRLSVTQDNIPDEKMREHSKQNWKIVLQKMKEVLEK